jgi:hypothetical protein
MSIVKAVFEIEHCRVPQGPYEMLEPDVGKLASPVLRGRGGGNIALLPDRTKVRRQWKFRTTQDAFNLLEK